MHLAAFDKCVRLLPPSCRALHSVSGPSLAPPCAAGPYMIARGFLGLPAGAVAHAIRILDCSPKATPLGVFGHFGDDGFRVLLVAVSFAPQLCRLLLRIPFCLRACAMVIRLTAQYVTKSKSKSFPFANSEKIGARQNKAQTATYAFYEHGEVIASALESGIALSGTFTFQPIPTNSPSRTFAVAHALLSNSAKHFLIHT